MFYNYDQQSERGPGINEVFAFLYSDVCGFRGVTEVKKSLLDFQGTKRLKVFERGLGFGAHVVLQDRLDSSYPEYCMDKTAVREDVVDETRR